MSAERSKRAEDSGSLVVEERFAIVPEWLLDSDIGDCAVRLYAVLLRYGQSSGSRMPSRSTLARRLRKRSTDTVDRAMKELVGIGAVRVQHRYAGAQRLTNTYHVQTTRPEPGRTDAATPVDEPDRNDAGTPTESAAGGRRDAARVGANSEHDPQQLTQSTTTSSPTACVDEQNAAVECGIEDWDAFVAEVQNRRRVARGSLTRWSGPCLAAALQLATRVRGWPAKLAAAALIQVAADPVTRSPARLAEAGPWWDEPVAEGAEDQGELTSMEEALVAAGGQRVRVQQRARAQLVSEGMPVTRSSVTRRAFELLGVEAPVEAW